MANPKVVVVTGASAGVGRATARLFAKQGANVALIARGTQGLETAQQEIETHGRRALVLRTDVSDAVEKARKRPNPSLAPSTCGSMSPWYRSFPRFRR